MGLREQLKNVKIEDECRRRREIANNARIISEQYAKDKAEAHAIFANIPNMVRDALAKDQQSVWLYHDASVEPEIEKLTGVARILRDLVQEEGLSDSLFVDIDISGNLQPKNALCLDLRKACTTTKST